jgi:predicted extracellular nuclease/2',3'-cyclic-nucleotide 2'-phosphodiesterase (5'-nucleotidase family)/phosphodiesterase/alkaline phosphatase D-like protein
MEEPAMTANSFPNGVAAGDVSQESAILWARSTTTGTLLFEFSTAADFSVIAGSQTAEVVDPDLPVKVGLSGLESGTAYFYRVTNAADETLTGRFETPAEPGTYAGLTFGVSGDWRGELTPYPALGNADERGLDFFVALGDTIYADFPSPAVPAPQAMTLEEFRLKQGEVLSEKGGANTLADLRASTAYFATIDDHEVTNDFAGGADPATDPRFAGTGAGFINDTALYDTGIRAFGEYNPIRAEAYGDTGDPRTAGEVNLYRSTAYGSDAAAFLLDARSFRDAQLDNPTFGDPADIARYLAESFDPSRTMLGLAQFEQLKQDLLAAQETGVTWKFVFVPEPIQNLGPIQSADRFEGYAAERNALLKFIDENGIANVVFVAADIHATLVNNLTYQEFPGGPQIATSAIEVTTGSVAFDAPFGAAVADFAAQLGFLTPQQKAFYDSLPVAPDADNIANDKDDFVKQLIDGQIAQFGYDPLGLDSNLPQADGRVHAELLQGDYAALHSYGWTEFKIDPATQQLRVTTFGVEAYDAADAAADPAAIAARTPAVIGEFTVTPFIPIHDIQGAGHISAFDGATVTTSGIVTARASNGFYIQDAAGDGDDATSEGIFVFTGSAPAASVAVGAEVQLTGRVSEFIPGGAATGNLSTTQIGQVSDLVVLSTGNELPAAAVLGAGGRVPPNQNIDDDNLTAFDPESDGIDFYESVEGMLVQVNDAKVVGATNNFGEIAVVADGGKGSGPATDNGGVYVSPDDFNPERILIDDALVANEPAVDVGDKFTAPVVGVVSYSFGNYKVLNTAPLPGVEAADNPREVTNLTGTADQLTVATFNVENLDPADGDPNPANNDRLDQLARTIVENMKSPDIIALQEMQDNNGATNNGVVAADRTFQELIDAIAAQGGPRYEYVQIDPQNNQDGGQPGANIRVGFLYNPDRVDFAPQGAAGATDANGVVADGFDAALTLNGGRIDPTNPAFNQDPISGTEGARKPLAAEFLFNGQKVILVANHLKSKSGDDPLFGAEQPAVQNTLAQRIEQAAVINAFVAGILAVDPSANVVVLGDMNDFEFSQSLETLKGDELNNLIEQIAAGDRYTFNFEGNSQTLDHILVSDNLLSGAAPEIDIVHLNTDYAAGDRASDHDPIVARLTIAAPAAVAGGNKADSLAGESGSDTLTGGNGNDTLLGGSGNDVIAGGNGNDSIAGGFGNDLLSGGNGDDKLDGGIDGDTLAGGNGRDTLMGGDHADLLSGGSGDDVLEGGAGDDTMAGGSGGDRFIVAPGGGHDRIVDFDADDDMVDLQGFGFADFAALLAAAAQKGADTAIELDSATGDRLTLVNTDLDDLEEGSFAGFTASLTMLADAGIAATDFGNQPLAAASEAAASATAVYTLQILHASDLEGSVDAIDRAANFAAIVDKLEDSYANSILLGAGDNWIPGPFFAAAGDPSVQGALRGVYDELTPFPDGVANNLGVGAGRVDVSIMNIVGFDASALGNHEFDAGTSTVASIIGADFRAGNSDVRWVGAQFPYLSANLDFSADANLNPLFTGAILDSTAFDSTPGSPNQGSATKKIAPATIIMEGGEKIGVVGATTPLLETISSPGATQVKDPGSGTNDMADLASILQPTIDQLIAQGVNKVILVSHLQQIALETELAGLLSGVDVIIAGGSSTLLADETDVLQPGDTAAGGYPRVAANADGDNVLIVSTDQEYKYLGRLVVDFDADGKVILDSVDPDVSGAYAVTDQTVQNLWGNEDPFAEGSKGDLVEDLVTAVSNVVTTQDGSVFGKSDVFLEGRRIEVRTEETNLGNLTADANLAYAQSKDATVLVSIKNGGGIRDLIGSVDGITGAELPTEANPDSGKKAGEISQLDIANALRFNNGLTLLTVTADQLLAVMEHAVKATAPGATPGQFAQIGGLAYSYDATRPAGDRVLSLAVTDQDGTVVDVIVRDGEVVGDPARGIRIVTLNFLANGGDGYPFPAFINADPAFADRVDLTAAGVRTGAATFADDGSEQDALAEYLAANHATTPYGESDRPAAEDERIQNTALREDTVLAEVVNQDRRGGFGADDFAGAAGDDRLDGRFGNDSLEGAAGNDTLIGGFGGDSLDGGTSNDSLDGGFGNDTLFGGSGDDSASGGFGDDAIGGGEGDDSLGGGFGNDTLEGGAGADQVSGGFGADIIIGGLGSDLLTGGAGRDRFVLTEIGEGVDSIADFRFGGSGDVLVIGDLLEGFVAAEVEGFLRLVESGGSTTLEVDADGGGDGFQALVTFQGATGLNLTALLDGGAIETASS